MRPLVARTDCLGHLLRQKVRVDQFPKADHSLALCQTLRVLLRLRPLVTLSVGVQRVHSQLTQDLLLGVLRLSISRLLLLGWVSTQAQRR